MVVGNLKMPATVCHVAQAEPRGLEICALNILKNIQIGWVGRLSHFIFPLFDIDCWTILALYLHSSLNKLLFNLRWHLYLHITVRFSSVSILLLQMHSRPITFTCCCLFPFYQDQPNSTFRFLSNMYAIRVHLWATGSTAALFSGDMLRYHLT